MDFNAKLKQIQMMSQKNLSLLLLTTELVSNGALPFCSRLSDCRDWVCRTPRVALRMKQHLQRKVSEPMLCCGSKLQ